jgi:AcrR family transcriptional regulator
MKDSSVSQFASASSKLRRRIRQRKQPVQSRSKTTVDAVLEATLQVLVRNDYAKLTTTRVAEVAGVSVGTLYQYFPDKRSLVAALKVRYFGLMVASVGAALDIDASTDLHGVLRRALIALVGVKRDHLELTKALRGPMADAEGLSFLRDTQAHFTQLIVPHLARALPGAQSIEARASILVASLEGAISHAVYTAPHWLLEDWFVEDLVALSVGYLSNTFALTGETTPRAPKLQARHKS